MKIRVEGEVLHDGIRFQIEDEADHSNAAEIGSRLAHLAGLMRYGVGDDGEPRPVLRIGDRIHFLRDVVEVVDIIADDAQVKTLKLKTASA